MGPTGRWRGEDIDPLCREERIYCVVTADLEVEVVKGCFPFEGERYVRQAAIDICNVGLAEQRGLRSTILRASESVLGTINEL